MFNILLFNNLYTKAETKGFEGKLYVRNLIILRFFTVVKIGKDQHLLDMKHLCFLKTWKRNAFNIVPEIGGYIKKRQ